MWRAIFGLQGPVQNITREYCYEHKDEMITFYNSHNTKIREIELEKILLGLSNHKGGWEPICNLLGLPIPDLPFPHVNKRDSMLRSMLT